MQTKIIEVTTPGQGNYGKFMVMKPDIEFTRESLVDMAYTGNPKARSLLRRCGWSLENIIVFDLQTGEGARFHPSGLAIADLTKHAIWVCPLFPHFLRWLYTQSQETLNDLSKLPDVVELDADFAMFGRRWADAKELADNNT